MPPNDWHKQLFKCHKCASNDDNANNKCIIVISSDGTLHTLAYLCSCLFVGLQSWKLAGGSCRWEEEEEEEEEEVDEEEEEEEEDCILKTERGCVADERSPPLLIGDVKIQAATVAKQHKCTGILGTRQHRHYFCLL